MPEERKSLFVLDCADAEMLAEFYAKLLGARTQRADDPEYIQVIDRQGVVRMAIHKEHGHLPPSWPRPEDAYQVHLRIVVPDSDLDAAEREAIGMGATPVEARDDLGRSDVRLFTDPAGHPFTLTTH